MPVQRCRVQDALRTESVLVAERHATRVSTLQREIRTIRADAVRGPVVYQDV